MVPVRRSLLTAALALVVAACSAAAAKPDPAPATGRSSPRTTTTIASPEPTRTTTSMAEPTTEPTRIAGPPPERDWVDFGAPEPEVDESLFIEYRVRVEPLPGTVALTFDDGPEPDWTPIILDILKEKGVTATFFVLGWKVDAYPEIAKRIVDEGHSLQSHSYRHHNLAKRSVAGIAYQIDETARAIYEATGTTPVCIRPPRGISSSRVVSTAADHDHEVVIWTRGGDSGDYAHGSRTSVLRRARTWQAGWVTLMHDTWGWLYRDVLGELIDEISSRGIGFSTICVEEEISRPVTTW